MMGGGRVGELAVYNTLGIRMRRISIFIVLILQHIANISVAHAGEIVRLEKEQAIRMLYGDSIFSSPRLKGYFNGHFENQDFGWLSLAFESSYTEQGKRKQLLLVNITPRPVDEYNCHGCAPLIGGGSFIWSGSRWVVESKSEIIGWGNSLGEKFSLTKVGPDKYGILDVIDDDHQGYEDKTIRLIVPYRRALRAALDVGFGEKPGSCEEAATPQQHATIKFVESKRKVFDVASTLKYNDGSCEKFTIRTQVARYRFVGGIYKRLSK